MHELAGCNKRPERAADAGSATGPRDIIARNVLAPGYIVHFVLYLFYASS
jgi:hypothetical protein